MHKTRPYEAVRSTPHFVIKERERRIKAREITKEQAAEEDKADKQQSHSPSLTDGTTVASDENAHEDVTVDLAATPRPDSEGDGKC